MELAIFFFAIEVMMFEYSPHYFDLNTLPWPSDIKQAVQMYNILLQVQPCIHKSIQATQLLLLTWPAQTEDMVGDRLGPSCLGSLKIIKKNVLLLLTSTK